MLAESFRLVTARLIPGRYRCKQLALFATAILAGCGGSSAPKASVQVVSGPGFRFSAPAGWTIVRGKGQVAASRGSELVKVAAFALQKQAYTDALFDKIVPELDARMRGVVRQSGGTLGPVRTVVVDRIRSHAYEVTVGDHVDDYTFVLRGMREYQLLCRRMASSRPAVCTQLVTSLRLSS